MAVPAPPAPPAPPPTASEVPHGAHLAQPIMPQVVVWRQQAPHNPTQGEVAPPGLLHALCGSYADGRCRTSCCTLGSCQLADNASSTSGACSFNDTMQAAQVAVAQAAELGLLSARLLCAQARLAVRLPRVQGRVADVGQRLRAGERLWVPGCGATGLAAT